MTLCMLLEKKLISPQRNFQMFCTKEVYCWNKSPIWFYFLCIYGNNTCVCLLHNFIQHWLHQLIFFYSIDPTWLRVWCVDCSDFLLSPAPGWCCPYHRGSVPRASGTGATRPHGSQCPILRTSINLCRFRNNHGNLHNRYQSGKKPTLICVWENFAMFIRQRSCWEFSHWTSRNMS